MAATAQQRLSARVETASTGCWTYRYPLSKGFNLHGKRTSVRRAVIELFADGPAPSRQRLVSTCGNDRCVSPAHLAIASAASATPLPKPARCRSCAVTLPAGTARRRCPGCGGAPYPSACERCGQRLVLGWHRRKWGHVCLTCQPSQKAHG